MNETPSRSKRNKNALVAEAIVKAIQSLRSGGVQPTFNALMAHLKSRGVLSNHGSLREYLDILAESGLLTRSTEPSRQPNIRPRQVYSVTHDGPFVEAGEKALVFHGLNWTVPARSSDKLKTDFEGVVRGRLQEGALYASLEDTVAGSLARADGKTADPTISWCAALLATKKVDRAYLMRRAKERGVGEMAQELLDEIDYLYASPKPEVEDIKSLYAVRGWAQAAHRRTPGRPPGPRWTLLSKDDLLDMVGKQLGVK